MKKLILATILGAVAGTLVSWAFDSFVPQPTKYFIKHFFKMAALLAVILFVFSKAKKTA